MPLWGRGAVSPSNTILARDKPYLLAKFHLDPSNRLATVHGRHRQDRTDSRANRFTNGRPKTAEWPTVRISVKLTCAFTAGFAQTIRPRRRRRSCRWVMFASVTYLLDPHEHWNPGPNCWFTMPMNSLLQIAQSHVLRLFIYTLYVVGIEHSVLLLKLILVWRALEQVF